jgi:RNA polymerase sigma-70 factor (ECF subfamily)
VVFTYSAGNPVTPPTRRHPLSEVAVVEAELEQQFAVLRPELAGYCYRMLGSTFDADDAVQETLMRAWRGAGSFEGRAPLRSWLYRIATNVCLSHLRRAQRRALPMDIRTEQNHSPVLGAPSRRESWVEPIPDTWVIPPGLDPAQVAVERASVRLAFVAALQRLTPRQRAVLLLRDVLKWRTREVADLLDTTPDAVNGVLRRARATLAAWQPDTSPQTGHHDHALLNRYVDAFQRFDIDALIKLLADEATLSMPPYALWLRGPTAIGAWFRATGASCRNARLVPIEASGDAGFAVYRQSTHNTTHQAFAIQVVETAANRITALHSFLDPTLFPIFGLTTSLGHTDDQKDAPSRPRRGTPPGKLDELGALGILPD